MVADKITKPTRTQRLGALVGNHDDLRAVFRAAAALPRNKVLTCIRYAVAVRAGVKMTKDDTAAHEAAWSALSEAGKTKVRAGIDKHVATGMALRAKDPTAAKRQAKAKAVLEDDGGKRLSVKLLGRQVKKVDRLMKSGFAEDQQAVIRRLIDESKCS
jgi:hypothetical protein